MKASMHVDSLHRLRILRADARRLLDEISGDLDPFRHEDDQVTFVRTPTSYSAEGDVNVTTTCSCVMALALTNVFGTFYEKTKNAADLIMDRLIDAPWMSSGLTSNNAFTTALVLRTYGFLKQYAKFRRSAEELQKPWDLTLRPEKVFGLRDKLKNHNGKSAATFIYRSLADKTKHLIKTPDPVDAGELMKHRKRVANALTADIRRIVHSGSIYEATRFEKASAATRQAFQRDLRAYELAEMNHKLLSEEFPDEIQEPTKRSFREIANILADSAEAENFRINDYPPSAPVVYWFVDGIARAQIPLEKGKWRSVCEWATREFNHQRSLVSAHHDAKMDPVSMGMAACLCARLQSLSPEETGITEEERVGLPSTIELEHAIRELFKNQTKSGIWPKYFPMFHYQEAGSNFCFTFELLEAVLHGFGGPGNTLLGDSGFIEGLERAVQWCHLNRLLLKRGSKAYRGWNSGGYLETLEKREPESWATAVVHMFLWELVSVLSEYIQRQVLKKYGSDDSYPEPTNDKLNDLLDVDLLMQGKREHLLDLLREKFVPPNRNRTPEDLRRNGVNNPISALLFGPPGTSKTRLAKAVAAGLGWPIVTINPSDFVKGSFENVYLKADEIFQDLSDLSAVVVFFDEMDALMQSREGKPLDTATQFLTTSMLPMLTRLHDKGRVVFLMATNYQAKFDPAIKRAGRFDLLLCMGPPTLNEKLNRLEKFVGTLDGVVKKEAVEIVQRLAASDPFIQDQLELLTYDEFREFLTRICSGQEIAQGLRGLDTASFKATLEDFSKFVTLRVSDLGKHYRKKLPEWNPSDENEEEALERKEIWRYLRDRTQSKKQYQEGA